MSVMCGKKQRNNKTNKLLLMNFMGEGGVPTTTFFLTAGLLP